MEIIELGALLDIRKGTKLMETEDIEGSIRMIMIGDLRNDDQIKYCIQNDKNIIVNKDDLIIAWDGANAGLIGFGLEGAIGSTLARLSLKNRSVHPDYLGLYLQYKSQEIRDNCTGATIPHVNRNHLIKMNIPVPPIEIQKQIVEVLDEAQKLIDNRKEQIELLDDLIESIFYDMFGDPVSNNKRWEVKKLGELGNLGRGKSKHRPRNHFSLYGGKYPFIQTGDVSNAGIYLDSFETTYSEKGLEQSKMWDKDTLCITIAANIAKTSILKINACFPDSIVGFIPNRYSNVIYIRTWFLFFQEIIEKAAPQSAQRNINLRILNNLDVIAPPISLQNEFAENVQSIEEQKELMSDSLKLMEDNYNSLMQRAFKGDLF